MPVFCRSEGEHARQQVEEHKRAMRARARHCREHRLGDGSDGLGTHTTHTFSVSIRTCEPLKQANRVPWEQVFNSSVRTPVSDKRSERPPPPPPSPAVPPPRVRRSHRWPYLRSRRARRASACTLPWCHCCHCSKEAAPAVHCAYATCRSRQAVSVFVLLYCVSICTVLPLLRCQLLRFCTSKATKLSTCAYVTVGMQCEDATELQ